MMLGRREKRAVAGPEGDVMDVTASMQGTIRFTDPVNLRIQGSFEGTLHTKGQLTVGEQAHVKAQIEGDIVTVAGKVEGKLVARELLHVTSTGVCVGEIHARTLSVESGGIVHGRCEMKIDPEMRSGWGMSIEEAAQFLEMNVATIAEWAAANQIPAIAEGDGWRFDKGVLEEWINREKLGQDAPRP